MVDVSEAPSRPPNLAPDAVWTPAPHRNIAGSVWIPGAGAGELADGLNSFFLGRLARLAGDVAAHPIVFYCHPNCWGSWNAAKRAIKSGYQNVYWYPDGIEGCRTQNSLLRLRSPRGVENAAADKQ